MWKPLETLVGFVSKPLEHWQARKTLTAEAKQARATLKVEQRFELDKLDHQAKVAAATVKLRMAEQGQQQDHDLDRIAMDNMKNSYADEIVRAIFYAPVVLAFIPKFEPYVKSGFAAIAEMPPWYMAIVIGITVQLFGLRGLFKFYLNRIFRGAKQPQAGSQPPRTGHPGIAPARNS